MTGSVTVANPSDSGSLVSAAKLERQLNNRLLNLAISDERHAYFVSTGKVPSSAFDALGA